MCSIPGTSQSHCQSVLSSGLPGPDNFGGRTGGFRGLLSRDRQKHFTNVLDHRRSSSGSGAARAMGGKLSAQASTLPRTWLLTGSPKQTFFQVLESTSAPPIFGRRFCCRVDCTWAPSVSSSSSSHQCCACSSSSSSSSSRVQHEGWA
jgi:hypothetical protein